MQPSSASSFRSASFNRRPSNLTAALTSAAPAANNASATAARWWYAAAVKTVACSLAVCVRHTGNHAAGPTASKSAPPSTSACTVSALPTTAACTRKGAGW